MSTLAVTIRAMGLVFMAALAMSPWSSAARTRQADQPQRDVPHNQYGAPLIDRSGHRIIYSNTQMAVQAARAPRSLLNANAAAAKGTPGSRPTWGYAAFGTAIGSSNIAIASVGGGREIYVGGSPASFGSDTYWYALRYSPATKDYQQVYVSALTPAPIQRIVVANVLGDSAQEIIIALEDGQLQFYDSASKSLIRQVSTGASGLMGLAAADLDRDGQNEIILATGDELLVYSMRTNGTIWRQANSGGGDVVVGQMDADSGLEIAAGGSVFDAATHAVQWTYPTGYGLHLALADIDADGRDELIVAEAWYQVWAYDVDRQAVKWSIPTAQDIGAIMVADINKDRVPDLLIGDGQWGSILAYNTVTRAQEWSIANPEHGVTALAIGDVDGDGATELLWGAGATSSGPDHLYVVDWARQQFEWTNVHLDGPFVGPELGDLDGDGRKELVVASTASEAGYGSGRILVFDSQTLRLRGMSAPIVDNLAWTGLHDLKLRDLNHDGRYEILVAADRLYDGVIEAYSFGRDNTFTRIWTNATQPFGAPFYTVDVADIDHDGKLEIVGGGGRAHTGADGTFLYAYSATTGAEVWHSDQLGDYWGHIAAAGIGNVDKDSADELVGIAGGTTYIFDGRSKQREATLPGTSTAMQVAKFQSQRAIVLGDTGGNLIALRYRSGAYSEFYRHNFSAAPIDGFTLGAPQGGIWVGSGGTLKLASSSGTTSWESGMYGAPFGSRTVLANRDRTVVSAGLYALIGFPIAAH